jgi:hypothetical protein
MDSIDLHDRIAFIAQTLGVADTPVWLTRFPRFASKPDFFFAVSHLSSGTEHVQANRDGPALPRRNHFDPSSN